MFIFPAWVPGWDRTIPHPMPSAALPKFYEGPMCGVVDDCFGPCEMPPTPHGLHRCRWDGHEASWRDFGTITHP